MREATVDHQQDDYDPPFDLMLEDTPFYPKTITSWAGCCKHILLNRVSRFVESGANQGVPVCKT